MRWLKLVRGDASDDFPLVRWFSLVSLLAVTLVSVTMALVLARFLETRLLDHDAELSRDFVQNIVETQNVGNEFLAGGDSVRSAGFAEFFQHVATMNDVLRSNVYGLDRRVLWSSDPALIGRYFDRNDELEDALKGELVWERGEVTHDSSLSKGEHVRLGGARAIFVENYLPVFLGQGEQRRQVGVVELYRVPTHLNETLQMGTALVWICSLLGGSVLYLSTLGLVRKASALMHEQRRRLVEADALALVGEIAAATAHSIRNPLASIRSTAELQREIGAMPPEMCNETIVHVDRIERLVRTLLTYTRDPAEVLGEADPGEILRGAAEHYRPAFDGQNKHLVLDWAGPLPTVRGDVVLLQQVLNSLLSNALEASGPQATVTVRAGTVGEMVSIQVQDHGSGMPAETLANAFKPFYTTKPRGLGMGLALVKRVLDRLGGSVKIDSRPGAGTTVTLLLPMARAAVDPSTAA
ncbi:sensor histidine kinase [Sphaerotilus mobilis]|uniref:histidine kinase n=1 Tax=Sphaerotilus mobilis TaxID=47994 RepID=A0A4Q7LL39_9BURK|nr:HAMP domain-containing sensor histidine kinase [Sphaerotilus mobilis]RZS54883.1 phospho-acceptor domain-containing protein [Sphaerotilus mobilis]